MIGSRCYPNKLKVWCARHIFGKFTGQSVGSMRLSFNGHDLFVSGQSGIGFQFPFILFMCMPARDAC